MGRSYRLGFCVSLLAAAAALAACGGSQPAPEAPAAAPSAEAPAAPAAPSAEAPAAPPAEAPAAAAPAAPAVPGDLVWKDDMPTKEKAEFMKKKVMPVMTKTFQDYDAKKYANFSCKTCHGPSMKPKPSEFLPQLHFKDGKITEAAKDPAVFKFMAEHVEHDMAGVFGKPPYDPKTGQGFGCNGCHKVNM